MKPIEYIAVETIAEACNVLAEYGADARVLAGGTDLLIEWRRSSTRLSKVVLDSSRASELRGITESDGSVTIRPLTTHNDLMRAELVQKFARLLGTAAFLDEAVEGRSRHLS